MRSRKARRRGAAMLELLLAAALSVFVGFALMRLLEHTLARDAFRRANLEAISGALLTERVLHRQAHLRARSPCDASALSLVLPGASPDEWLQHFTTAARGFAADSQAARAVRATGDAPGARVADSDVLMVRQFGAPAVVAAHDAAARRFALSAPAGFERGRLALVCNRRVAALFQVTSVSGGGRALGYGASAGVRPGNCGGRAGERCRALESQALDGALIAPVEIAAWYVGHGRAPGARSLYRRRLLTRRSGGTIHAALHAEEMVAGVAALRVRETPSNWRGAPGLDLGIVAVGGGPAPADPPQLFGESVSLPDTAGVYFVHEFSLAP